MDPLAADHRRDDLDRLELVGRALERVAGEDGDGAFTEREAQLSAPLGKLELCNRLLDTGIVKERLLDCDELLAVTVGMYVSP